MTVTELVKSSPSREYTFFATTKDERFSWSSRKPTVQVQDTPALYNAATIAALPDGECLAIDRGQNWRLTAEDTAAFRKLAQIILLLSE